MVARRSSVSKGLSVWMFLLLEWGRCVGLVLQDTLETHSSVMVSLEFCYCHLFVIH